MKQPSNTSELIRHALKSLGDATPADVGRMVGMPADTVATMLGDMCARGHVERVERGVYRLVGPVVVRRVNHVRDAIREALVAGEKTVADLAREIGAPRSVVGIQCLALSKTSPSLRGRTCRLARVDRATYALLHGPVRPRHLRSTARQPGRPPTMEDDGRLVLLRCSECARGTADLAEILDMSRDDARSIARNLYRRRLLLSEHRDRQVYFTTTPKGLAELEKLDAAERSGGEDAR